MTTPVANGTTVMRRSSSSDEKHVRLPWILGTCVALASLALLIVGLVINDWGDADRVIVVSRSDGSQTVFKSEVDLGLWAACGELTLESGDASDLLSGGGLFDNCENIDRVDNLQFTTPVRVENNQIVVTESGWQNVPADTQMSDMMVAARVLGIIAVSMIGVQFLLLACFACVGLASVLAGLFMLIWTALEFTVALLFVIFGANYVDAYRDASLDVTGPDYDLGPAFIMSLIGMVLLVPLMLLALWGMHRAHRDDDGKRASSSAEVVTGTAAGAGATAAVLTPH